jgi:hypothetical protein
MTAHPKRYSFVGLVAPADRALILPWRGRPRDEPGAK